MTVLVTGASGFFGSAIVRAMTAAGYEVVAFDQTPERVIQAHPDGTVERVRHVVGDVTDLGDLDPGRFQDVTGIVHAAALSLPDEVGEAARILDVNVRGTMNILTLAGQLPRCERFVQVSSAGVYDLSRPVSIREADATGGGSLYGATKLAAEILAVRMGEVLGFDVGVVRPSSLWGPGEIYRPTRPFVTPLHQLVDCARRGEAVEPQGLDAAWDWIYVDDAAEGLTSFFALAMGGRRVTLATGRPVTFRDVLAAVIEVFDLRIQPGGKVIDGAPDRPGRLKIESIVAATGWRPTTGLVEGLMRYRTYLDETPGPGRADEQAVP